MTTSHYNPCYFFHRNWRAFWGITVLVGGISANAEAGYITGNLLTDPSFESNPLISFWDILNPPYTTNAWGGENSAISVAASGITPTDGTKMLRMTRTGGNATQAWQLINVSAYSADINASNVTADFTSLFNVPASVAAGNSAVILQFYDALHAEIGTFYPASIFLDSITATWETASLTNILVPANTEFLLAQVLYTNVSIGTDPGYVDSTHLALTVVPEPSSILLFTVGFLSLTTRQIQNRKLVSIRGPKMGQVRNGVTI